METVQIRKTEPADAAFLYMEDEKTHAHGTFIFLYEPDPDGNGKVSFDDIHRHIESKLDVSEVFKQKLARVPLDLDFPYWVADEEFDLENHVSRVTLPKPGGRQELFAEMSRIHSMPMDLDRPVWELHVIEGMGDIDGLPKGVFALLVKFHHVAMDGATSMSIIGDFHDAEPGGNAPGTSLKTVSQPANMPSLPVSLVSAGISAAQHTVKGLQAAGGLLKRLPNILSVIRLSSLFDGSDVPETMFNQPVSSEKVVDSRFFNLEEIKQIRQAVPGATVNDVLLAICGGGLRRLLESKDELPDSSMVVACPINVRTEDETDSGGNRITTMFASVHTEIADPIERLHAVCRTSTKAKRTIEAMGARNLMELGNSLPSPVLALAATALDKVSGKIKTPTLFNCPVSNLPGPHKPLYLAGARLLHIGCGMPVMDGFGLFIGICTAENSLSFTVSSAKNILPEPSQLTMHIEHAFKAY